MTLFASELTEVAPKDPAIITAVGSYIVAVNLNTSTSGLMPNGSFVVMDTTTEAARAYTGLDTSTNTFSRPSIACSAGGYAWVQAGRGYPTWQITPSTGGITSYTTASRVVQYGGSGLVASGNYLFSFSNSSPAGGIWNWSTNTNVGATENFTTAAGVASDGSIWSFAGGNVIQRDSSMSIAGTWSTAAVPRGVGVLSGGLLWFVDNSTNFMSFDPATRTVTNYSHSSLSAGSNAPDGGLALSSGWLYHRSSTDKLIGFEIASGTFGAESLTPARSRRYGIAAVGGKLWVPSGEPLT